MMNNKRVYKAGLVVSLLVAVISLFLPESLGSVRAIIFGVGVLLFLVFLIALIVASVKVRQQAVAPEPDPTPTPSPTVSVAVPTVSRKPAPVPAPTPTPDPTQPKPIVRKATKSERIHVRGVDHYRQNVLAVASENPDYDLTKQELIEYHLDERVYQYDFIVKGALVPEPDNEYDPNAIMVHANGLCIGYVPKGSTAHVRKLMESGRIKSMDLDISGGKYKQVYETEDDKYELDRGEKNFTAILDLFLTEE